MITPDLNKYYNNTLGTRYACEFFFGHPIDVQEFREWCEETLEYIPQTVWPMGQQTRFDLVFRSESDEIMTLLRWK